MRKTIVIAAALLCGSLMLFGGHVEAPDFEIEDL